MSNEGRLLQYDELKLGWQHLARKKHRSRPLTRSKASAGTVIVTAALTYKSANDYEVDFFTRFL